MVKVDVKVKRDKYLRTEEIHRWVRMKRVGVNVFIIFSKKIVYVYEKIIYIQDVFPFSNSPPSDGYRMNLDFSSIPQLGFS
jgi:hypothetical protein